MDRGAWRTQFMGLQKLDRTEHAHTHTHTHTVIGNNFSFYSLNLVFSETGPNTGNFQLCFNFKNRGTTFYPWNFFFFFFLVLPVKFCFRFGLSQ